MNDRDRHLLLERYLSGECTPAEEAVLRQELTKQGESLAWLDALREARVRALQVEPPETSRGAVPSAEVTQALARLDQRLVDAGLRPGPVPRLRLEQHSPRSHRWSVAKLRVAAVACLVVAGTAGGAWLAGLTPHQPGGESVAAMREFVTMRGQRAVFRLIDGSEVILGMESRLRVPRSYGTARRDVYLEGEAYFTVMHEDTRPFVVHTAHGTIRDIGTRFSVRAYPDDAVERVVVAEGAVAVGTDIADERTLTAGQLAMVSPAGAVSVADRVDVDYELAWTRGELHFRNTPLSLATRRLGRWYDIDIRLADSALAGRPVSGTYAGEPLDQVLTLIAAAVGARFERRGADVVIIPMTGGSRP